MPKKKKLPEDSRDQQWLPHEKVQKRRVDVDLSFKRALQMVDWYMDRMDNEINHSQGFSGVPAGFNTYIRDLSSAMNTLSLSHARWLKANEEMYDRLSDDEKLVALQDWLVALHAKDKARVTRWMQNLAYKLLDASKASDTPTAVPGREGSAIAEVIGGPVSEGRPQWKEIAQKVREDFARKKRGRMTKTEVRNQARELTGLKPPKPLDGAKGIAANEPDPEPDGN